MIHTEGVSDLMQNQVMHAIAEQLLLHAVIGTGKREARLRKGRAHAKHIVHRAGMHFRPEELIGLVREFALNQLAREG